MKRDRKKLWKTLILCLLISGSLLMTACQAETTTQQTEKEQQSTKKETTVEKEETKTEIPTELLPGKGAEVSEQKENVYDVSKEQEADTNTGKRTNQKQETGSGNSGGSSLESGESSQITVQFSIDSSNASNEVSYHSSITLKKGATVYDALAASGVSYTGGSYISGIGGLFEKDYGPQSGWKYYVNGSEPGKSCNKYILQNGDHVQWSYVLNP